MEQSRSNFGSYSVFATQAAWTCIFLAMTGLMACGDSQSYFSKLGDPSGNKYFPPNSGAGQGPGPGPDSNNVPGAPVPMPPTFEPNGILNGHFDVDTATGSLPFPIGSGTVTYHVHEYDKVNQTTTVDFFKLLNGSGLGVAGKSFDLIQNTIASNKRFYLIIVNSNLNPGGILQINSNSGIRVTDYQTLNQVLLSSGTPPPVFTIQNPQIAGDQQLTQLKMAFDSNIDAKSLLVPTSPNDCVFINTLGDKGEYRNGALVVQAIDVNSFNLNATTQAEDSTSAKSGLLWEGVIYNHYLNKNGTKGTACYPTSLSQ